MSDSDRKLGSEALEKLRRLRKARRLFKQEPLFAFYQMASETPGYTYDQFLDDLRRRSKKKPKEKKMSLFPIWQVRRYKG